MRIWWAAGKFHPHEPARAEALAGVPLASFRARAAAFAIDFFLVVLAFSPLYVGFEYVRQRLHGVDPNDVHVNLDFGFHDVGSLVALVLYFGLVTYWWNGRTIGKRLLKIRVVSLLDERLSLWQSVERALGYGASALEGGFGFVQYFVHGNHCCLHDRIAETIVVKTPRVTGAFGAKVVEQASEPVEVAEGSVVDEG